MADYGVIPTGFNRKPLRTILSEIEASLATEFGPNVIQSPQSPLGQINGLMADLIAQLWEFGEEVYQSYDPDQAEGVRLDTLAKIRLLSRAGGEFDNDFRLAITNQGRARIDIPDIVRAVAGVTGVTYVQVFVNDTTQTDENLVPPGSVCVAVLGGDNEEIAAVIRRYVVPGISTYGNTPVSTIDEGYCRSMVILRPILVPVKLVIRVKVAKDTNGCPPPSTLAIRDTVVASLAAGDRKLINGSDVTPYRLRSIIESSFTNVEYSYFTGERDGVTGSPDAPIVIGFIELATVSASNVSVEAV